MLLVSLLFTSVRLSVRAKGGIYSGYGRLRVEWLFFRYTLFFHANLLRQPRLSIEILKKSGGVWKRFSLVKEEKGMANIDLPAPDEWYVHAVVGLRNEAALSALLCGWLREGAALMLGALLPPDWGERLCLSAECQCQDDIFFLKAEGMITLTPVQIIAMGYQARKRGP